MIYKDGSSYNGQWKDDDMNGYGNIIWTNGKKYLGYLTNHQKNGKRITYDAKGNKEYEGDYVNGLMEGYGVLYDVSSGLKYEGEFKNDNMEGQGTFNRVDEEGSKFSFIGEFKQNNFYNGTLILIKPNGTKYATEYKNGNMRKTKQTN